MRALRFHGRLGTFTWRMLATVLAGESVIVFFGALVARALASAEGDERGGTWLAVGSVLAVLALLAAGGMRRTWGVTLGWLVQAATFAAALVVPAMALVGLIFGSLWVGCLVVGQRVDAEQAARHRDEQGPGPSDDAGVGAG